MIKVHIIDEREDVELDMSFKDIDALNDAMYHIRYLFNTVNEPTKNAAEAVSPEF